MNQKKIPITIGIVGHRDAIITVEHRAVIQEILSDLQNIYPQLPVVLFSQLATGADTIVAEIFITEKIKYQRDYTLMVPTPFPMERYKQDFDLDDLVALDTLLEKAERTFPVKCEEDLKDGYKYRKGGQFVADGSMILIALWDGTQNGLVGGTGETVKYKIEGSYNNKVTEQIFNMKGGLIVIPCNRESTKDKKTFQVSENLLPQLLKSNSNIKKALDRIEAINKALPKMQEKEIDKSALYLFPDDTQLTTPLKSLRSNFAILDTLALKNQKIYKRWLSLFFWFGLILFLSFEAYKQFKLEKIIFFITLVLIIVSFFVSKLKNQWKSHNRYLEYRVLAEAVRIQFFWNLGNINQCVSQHILHIHQSEHNWIKYILYALYGLSYEDNCHLQDTSELVKTHWIENQKQYFTKKLEEFKQKEKKFKGFYVVILILAVVGLISIFIMDHYGYDKWINWAIMFDTLLFGLYAIRKAYYEKSGIEELEHQYTLMKKLYTAASDKIDLIANNKELAQDEKQEQLHKILELAGKEALVETGNWNIIYKDKGPEMEGVG